MGGLGCFGRLAKVVWNSGYLLLIPNTTELFLDAKMGNNEGENDIENDEMGRWKANLLLSPRNGP